MDLPTLTDRRKAATERDIADAAAALFAERGVGQVTADEIAARAGVSVRTFYRYFPRKEDAIVPFLAVGAARWQAALAEVAQGDLLARIPEIITSQLSGDAGDLQIMRTLLRGMPDDEFLRDAWRRVNDDSERRLREIIGARADIGDLRARILAAVATDAIRLGLEHWASTDGEETPAELAVAVFALTSRGLSDDGARP